MRETLSNSGLRCGERLRACSSQARPVPLTDVEEARVRTAEQTRTFIASAAEHPDGALWTIALTTGVVRVSWLG
jgi:hypothetical protein